MVSETIRMMDLVCGWYCHVTSPTFRDEASYPRHAQNFYFFFGGGGGGGRDTARIECMVRKAN